MKNYESPLEALTDLKTRGYTTEFETLQTCLFCGDLDIRLNPEEFTVDEVYRFEGDSNPDDNSIIYAITSDEGVKGTLMDAYGAYSANLSFDMVQKLRDHHSMYAD